MAQYTYLLADLRSNAILAELPLRPQGPIETRLSGFGQFRASVNLAAKGMEVLDLPSLLCDGAARSALYVDRDGVLVWGGILWGGTRSNSAHSADLTFREFESYLQTRLILADYKPAGVDQLAIARALIATMQAKLGGNIGLQVGTETSGVLRTRDYFRTSLTTVAEALRALVELEFGFDVYISVSYDSNGEPTKTLRLGYPQLGRGAAVSGLDFQLPGNITGWIDDWDAFADSATDYYELGQGEGSSVLIGSASDPSAITAGYPVLERKSSLHRDANTQDLVNGHAREDLSVANIPVKTYSCQVKAGADPELGSYIPGDAARFRITDDWHKAKQDGTPGLDTYLRILGYGIQPENDLVDLTLGAAR